MENKPGKKPGERTREKPGYGKRNGAEKGKPSSRDRKLEERKSGSAEAPRRFSDRKTSGLGSRPQGDPRKAPAGKPYGKPAPRPAAPQPSVNARRTALEVFEAVVRQDAFAALSLDEKLRSVNLPQLDKRFCASIVYTTLENLIRIDYALSFFLKDAENLEPRIRDILRISACQMLFHDRIPDSAVVDEAVKLTRTLGYEGMTGLVNAVLRSLARGKEEIKWPGREEGARYLSVLYSVPLWLCERLTAAYGPEEAEKICAYRSESHYTVIRPNLMQYTDAEFEKLLEKKVWTVVKGKAAHAFRVRGAAEIGLDADYQAGHFSIQGEGSMIAAQAVNAMRGMQILDCCAAPGGKTAYLAETMQGTGRVYAWDVYGHRVRLIQAQMRRLRLDNVRPAERDASVLREDLLSAMDAVLLDAPCSGLGVMDNKPDIKYRASAQSLQELTELQAKLLDTCCRYVKKNGTLVYSTCSILPEENVEQVRRFLKEHPEFQISPLPDTVDAAFRQYETAEGLQLLPHRDGVEGFFIARMIRVK